MRERLDREKATSEETNLSGTCNMSQQLLSSSFEEKWLTKVEINKGNIKGEKRLYLCRGNHPSWAQTNIFLL